MTFHKESASGVFGVKDTIYCIDLYHFSKPLFRYWSRVVIERHTTGRIQLEKQILPVRNSKIGNLQTLFSRFLKKTVKSSPLFMNFCTNMGLFNIFCVILQRAMHMRMHLRVLCMGMDTKTYLLKFSSRIRTSTRERGAIPCYHWSMRISVDFIHR